MGPPELIWSASEKHADLQGSDPGFSLSAADAHVAAGGAVVAAVAPDQRAVAALGAGRAGQHRILLGRGRLEDAHLRAREAVLVEDAEHGVAVHDEAREVGDRR